MSGKEVSATGGRENYQFDNEDLTGILHSSLNQDQDFNKLVNPMRDPGTGNFYTSNGVAINPDLVNRFWDYGKKRKESAQAQADYVKAKADRPGRDQTIMFDKANSNLLGI